MLELSHSALKAVFYPEETDKMKKTAHRRAKLIDIAKQTGYTVGTISKALQNKDGISKETRESILRAAKEMGYIANAQAGALRSGSSKMIAIIVGDIANPLFAIEIKICTELLEKHGYRAIVMDTEERPEREEAAVISALNKNVDGVLICPSQQSTRNIQLLKQNGMPFVLMGRRFRDYDADYVVCDDEEGGYLAGKHLLDLGHERILLITAGQHISSSYERLAGFTRAMQEHHVSLDPDLILEANASASEAADLIDRALASELHFSAIFTFSDLIAWEVIYALEERDIKVPQDISVMGFDDVQSHMCFPPPLTTVHFPKRKLVSNSVALLLDRIQSPGEETEHRVLSSHLVIRKTTSKPHPTHSMP